MDRAQKQSGVRRYRLSSHTAFVALLLCASACAEQGPATPADLRQQALVFEQQGRSADAEAAWQLYLKTHPSSSEAFAHLGLLEARQEHYREAVPLYQKALALRSTIPGLRLDLGLAFFKTGEMREALEQFSVALKSTPPSSPDRPRLTILMGMCHYGLGEYAKAVPYLRKAAGDDPQNAELRLALAHSCLWSKQYQCVLDTYHEILMLNAESAEADMLAGEALDEMKDVNGAIQQFRDAVKTDPRMPDVHFGLGYLFWTKRQYPEAAAELQAELDNNPTHAQALTYLGDCELKLGHPDAAAPLLEKAIRVDSAIELAHLDLGSIDADAGRPQEAERELMAAARLAPNDVNVHWHLARLYRSMGKQDQARAEFDKARNITQAADAALIDKLTPHPAAAPEK